MAHILVYLERTPGGLHPASAVALCRARDIASTRGASITAVCLGDAGALDKGVAAAAGRFGADVLVFGGVRGLRTLYEQLNPVHVMVPWTEAGLAAVEGLPNGPAVPRWLTTRQPAWGGADAITAVVAGLLPWHALSEVLEAEYQADVDAVPQPAWVTQTLATEDFDIPVFGVGGLGSMRWTGIESPDAETRSALSRMGAGSRQSVDESLQGEGTVLWISGDPVPPALAHRPAGVRLIVVPGVQQGIDPSWRSAEWVLPGAPAQALGAILDSPWAPRSG